MEVHVEEAGQRTECPLCQRRLIVPQAPAGNTTLLISAALAGTRAARSSGAPVDNIPAPARKSWIPYVGGLVVLLALGVTAALLIRGAGHGQDKDGEGAREADSLWTTNFAQLVVADRAMTGRLNGWEFTGDRATWRGTRLILRQRDAAPSELGVEIDLPVKGGDVVPGKRFDVTGSGDALQTPIVVSWRNEQGQWQRVRHPGGYIMRMDFTGVTTHRVSGRIHLCLTDAERSWVAGRFDAEIRTGR